MHGGFRRQAPAHFMPVRFELLLTSFVPPLHVSFLTPQWKKRKKNGILASSSSVVKTWSRCKSKKCPWQRKALLRRAALGRPKRLAEECRLEVQVEQLDWQAPYEASVALRLVQ